MKSLYVCIVFFITHLSFSQDTAEYIEDSNPIESNVEVIGNNGYSFVTLDTGINTKFSEFGSGFFMNKFIMVSAKKLGGLAKTDKTTDEGYRNLFCVDINKDGTLDNPILFSRLINTLDNEDQVTFLPDGQTMYFTRSTEEGSAIYKLYKTTLEKNSKGNWLEQQLLDINVEGYSIENPFVNPNGDKLYFSSNKPGGFGGYDLYVARIRPDGTLYDAVNLGDQINTAEDDKYPSISKDGKQIYFSSKGHANIGGFDIFTSRIRRSGYSQPVNLGSTINTQYDEVAFFLASRSRGYLSSDKSLGKGRYDIYKFNMEVVAQQLKGVIVDSETKIPLPNAKITLFNDEGQPVAVVNSDDEARYNFEILPFENYTITATKDGFEENKISFIADNVNQTEYNENLELVAEKAVIADVEEKKMIVVNNIYFDYNRATIKDESQISLNSIAVVLREHPEMKIQINAHTDNRGNNAYNLRLSKLRAASAMNYLISKGVDKNRLLSNGYGETQPLFDCKSKCTEEQHQANRRVEFVIME
ncbi:OmpA family protein [Olleya aquimaris]|uniref:Outer membrane protein OmpA-like peptidoglycan-associated protein n=1 Tax=Olleya aquimaris TaxID=639310 RepID=A0A327RD98_9FLAO|nr:OmpA family protein [Olleya aquimaris]RAJ14681.1 outer membrane protein OmpA-like peptidoglycan-associated protein [Olleya aquimaris]